MKYKSYLIKDIIQLNYGKSLPKSKRIEGDIPVYGSGGITGFHNDFLVKGPSIIIGRKGTVGSLFYEDRNFFPIDTTYYVLPSTEYDLKYIYYLFQTIGLEQMNTHSAVPGLNRDGVYAKGISLPSISYQKKVSDFMSLLEKKIELNNQTINTLEEMASTLFKSWFVDFEFPDDNGNPYKSSGGKMIDSELGEIPEGFTVNKLNEVVEVKYGKDHKKLSEGNYPVYGSGGLMRVVDKYLYTGESVLIPRKGSLNNIMYVNESFWTVDTMFFTKMKKTNVAKYIYLTLIRIDFTSMNVGSAVPSMTTAVLNDLSIVIPSNNILNDFDYRISTLFQQKKSLENENKKLSALRDTLLPKLLSGEIEL